MTDYSHDIKRYLGGEMTPAEMQALEKKALSDPFLAEALEGASQLPAGQFNADVAELNKVIGEQGTGETGIHRVTGTRWALRIAAGLVLMAVATFALWQFIKPTDGDSLALSETIPEALSEQSGDKDTESETPAESATITDQEGSAERNEAGRSATTYPPDAQEKPEGRTAEEKSVSRKADEEPVDEHQAAPVLAEAPKAKEQTEELPKAEKAAELAAADQREEEGRLDKKDQASDDRKKVAGVTRTGVGQNQHVIQGRVTAKEDGTPLPGVNVVIKGTHIGTVTDASGNYQIESDQLNPSLVFSFIGLQSQELATGERKQVDVQLAPDAAQLSEVVVTGYGIQGEGYVPTVELAHPSVGNRAFKQYLENNLRYPKEALDKKVEGRVTIEFFVEANGGLSNFEVIRSIGSGCDEELIRLVQEGPKWEPTKRNGVPVRDKARVRLKFELPRK